MTKSGLASSMSGNEKLKPYLDALPSARLAPTTDPTWDKVKLDVQQSIGAGRPAGRRPEAGARPPPEERGGERSLTGPRPRRPGGAGRALLWLGPSLVLIAAVVIYPAVELVRASLGRYSITGLYQGAVGLRNYARLLEQEALPAVVGEHRGLGRGGGRRSPSLLSLGLAQLLNESFPGRRLVRWALIVPWAASLIMTSKLFVWIYDYYFGLLNRVLTAAGSARRSTGWATTAP